MQEHDIDEQEDQEYDYITINFHDPKVLDQLMHFLNHIMDCLEQEPEMPVEMYDAYLFVYTKVKEHVDEGILHGSMHPDKIIQWIAFLGQFKELAKDIRDMNPIYNQ